MAGGALLLDKITAPANVAVSCYRKLRGAYAGAALRVRRSSDNTEQDVGFAGNLVDQGALLAFVGAGSGYVTTLYDQGTNARNMVNTDPAAQPRIVNAGVLETVATSRPAMVFDGANDTLNRIGIGLIGNPDITVGCAANWTSTGGLWGLGGDSPNGARMTMYRAATGPTDYVYKEAFNSSKAFTPISNPATGGHAWVMQHAAGGTTQSGVLRQDGVAISLTSTTGVVVPLNLNLDRAGLGSMSTLYPVVARVNVFAAFNAVLAGADLSALETELAAHL